MQRSQRPRASAHLEVFRLDHYVPVEVLISRNLPAAELKANGGVQIRECRKGDHKVGGVEAARESASCSITRSPRRSHRGDFGGGGNSHEMIEVGLTGIVDLAIEEGASIVTEWDHLLCEVSRQRDEKAHQPNCANHWQLPPGPTPEPGRIVGGA